MSGKNIVQYDLNASKLGERIPLRQSVYANFSVYLTLYVQKLLMLKN